MLLPLCTALLINKCPALPCPALPCPIPTLSAYTAVLCRVVLCLVSRDLCFSCWAAGGAGEQAELLPCDAEIERVLGVSLRGVEGMDKSVRQVLGGDTSAISTLRCLKLYLERMGSDFQNASELHRIAGEPLPPPSPLPLLQVPLSGSACKNRCRC